MIPPRDLSRYEDTYRSQEFPSVDDFLAHEPIEGMNHIRYGNGFLDLLVEDNGAATTVVIFHAAMNLESVTTPVFVGLNMLDEFNVNKIVVSDPTLELGVGLGWYVGDVARPLQRDLVKALHHVNSHLENGSHLIFYGASGGGFAALFYSSYFPGSLAMPMNPQVAIENYFPQAVQEYKETAWPEDLDFKTQPCLDVRERYSVNRGNAVLYLQNLGDRPHVRNHLVPFLEAAQTSDVQVALKLGRWGFGHRAPVLTVYAQFFAAAITAHGNWDALFQTFQFEAVRSIDSLLQSEVAYLNQLKREGQYRS